MESFCTDYSLTKGNYFCGTIFFFLFSFFNGKRWEKQNTENLQNICITNFLIVNLFSSLFDFDTSIYEDNLTCMNDIGQNCQVIFVIVNKYGGHYPEM